MPTPHYIQCRFNAFTTDGVGAVMICINRASPTGTKNGRNIYNNDDLKFTQLAADTIYFDNHRLLSKTEAFTIEKSKQENGLILTTDLNQIVLDSPQFFSGVVNGSPVSYNLIAEKSTLFEWFLYDDQAKYRIRIIRQRADNTFEHLFIGDFRRKNYKFANVGITGSPGTSSETSRKNVTIHAAPMVQSLKDVLVSDLTWTMSDMQDNAHQTPFYTGMRFNSFNPFTSNGDPNPEGLALHQLLVDYTTGKNPKFNNSQGARATTILSYTPGGTVANGDTVTIDAKVYTFQTVLTGGNGHVQRGAAGDPAASLINLLYAINATPNQSGIAYDAATTKHDTVECNPSQTSTIGVTSNQLTVNAIIGGTAGNSIAVSEASVNLQWTSSTLTGGSTSPTFDPPAYATFGFDVVDLVTTAYVLGYGYNTPVFPAGIHGLNLYTIFNKLLTHPDVDITISGYDPLPLKGFSQLWNGGGWTIDESTPIDDPLLVYACWNTLFGLDPNVSLRISTATNTSPIVVTLQDFNPPYLPSFVALFNEQDTIVISDVTGNDGAIGTWKITFADFAGHPEQITLVGSAGTGTGTGGIAGKIISTPVTYSPDTLFFDVFRDFLLQTGYVAECGANSTGDPIVYLRDRRSINGVSVPTSFKDHIVGDVKPTTEEEFIPPPSLTLRYKGDDDYIIVDHRPLPDDIKIDLTIPLRTHSFADAAGNVYGRHLVYNSKIPIDQQINAQFQRNTSYNLDNVPNGWLPGAFMYRNWPTNETGSLVFPPAQPSQGVAANPSWIGNFAINIVQNKDDIAERTKLGFNYGESHLYTLAQFYANALNIRPTRSVTRTYSKLKDDSGDISWLKPGVADSFFWDGENRSWESIKMVIDLRKCAVQITYVEQPDYATLDEYKIITISSSNSSGGGASSATDGGSGGANPPGTVTSITDYVATDPQTDSRNDITPALGKHIALGLKPNSVTTEIAFYELVANGTNYVSLKAPVSLAANNSYVFPDAYPASSGYGLISDTSGNLSWVALSGTGTVTSVALTAPSEITVSGSPITTSGTLALTWTNETTNKVFAAPNGSTGTPTFRLLRSEDLKQSRTNYGLFLDDGSGNITQTALTGTTNYILTSNGDTALPTFKNGALTYLVHSPNVSAFNNVQPVATGVIAMDLMTANASTVEAFRVRKYDNTDFFNIDYTGIINTYLGLNLNNTTNAIGLYDGAALQYGSVGDVLTSQGTGATPYWTNINATITGTQYEVLAGTGSPGVHSISSPSQTGMVLCLANGAYPFWSETPALGAAGHNTGIIEFKGATSGGVNLSIPDAATLHTLKLPGTQGAANTFLKNDGSGNLSWSTASGGVSIGDAIGGGTNQSVLFIDNSGNLGQDYPYFVYDPSSQTLVAFDLHVTDLLTVGTGASQGIVRMYDGVSRQIRIICPTLSSNWDLTLPTAAGTNGYVLTTDGSGVTSWTNPLSLGASKFAWSATSSAGAFQRYVPLNAGSADNNANYPTYAGGYNVKGSSRVPFSGTIKNLYVVSTGASNGTDAFTVYINGVASAVTVTIANTASSGSDLTHTATFSAGDGLSIGYDAGGNLNDWSIGVEIDPN